MSLKHHLLLIAMNALLEPHNSKNILNHCLIILMGDQYNNLANKSEQKQIAALSFCGFKRCLVDEVCDLIKKKSGTATYFDRVREVAR